MHKDKKIYSTDNLFLATTLSLFYPIESIEFISPRQATFIFLYSQELSSLIESYWKGELKLEPKALFSQLKIVKSRLYEGGNRA